MNPINLPQPYLIFLGAIINPLDAKTGFGLKDWAGDQCVGQLRLPGCQVDLGLPDMTLAQAVQSGAKSLVLGVAPTGGRFNDAWLAVFEQALDAGLDLVSGLHTKLNQQPALVEKAARLGRQLIDIRTPPAQLPVASGKKRTGLRLLTVGTDCACGKKYTALALHRALVARGLSADFRVTGQTGILIAGQGLPLDAVVSDFLAGSAELLSPDNDADHWDLIEGQGSLYHPAYAAVTLGLIHGSQPDALVLCHQAGRSRIDDYPDYPLPSLNQAIEDYERAARLTNPRAKVVDVSLNTHGLDEVSAQAALAQVRAETGLPCADPLRTGLDNLVEVLAAWN